jgi:hypothetical protein
VGRAEDRTVSAKVNIEISEETLRILIVEYIQDKLGTIECRPNDVTIEVKSKHNYKAEWEPAHFRATVSKLVC